MKQSLVSADKYLAINGGMPTLTSSDIVKWCPILDTDRDALMRVLDQNEIAGPFAPETVKLQTEWSNYLGIKHSLLTNSGTAALHMALASVGITAGDEVIVPAYTFVASATAVLHQNAIPIFADIEKDQLHLSVSDLEAKITPRTKAIVLVHLNGMPASFDEVKAIAEKYHLKIVEDACQAHGAIYKGKKVGTLGDAAAFSLNKSKNLPGGEGGLFVTNNSSYLEKAEQLYKFGEIYHNETTRNYEAYGMGWMYRSTEFVAAITRSRLPYLNYWIEERKTNVEYLNDLLKDLKGIALIKPLVETEPAYWRYAFRVVPEALGIELPVNQFRQLIESALVAEGVPISQWQKMTLPQQTLFKRREGYGNGCPWSCKQHPVDYQYLKFPYAEDAVDRLLWIKDGIQPFNSTNTIEKIAQAIRKVITNIQHIIS